MLSQADQESLHRYCTRNRSLLAKSEQAGCFCCEALFEPNEITDWIDGQQVETGSTDDGVTALCPRCGIDAVLPGAAPIELSAEVLKEMNRHWF